MNSIRAALRQRKEEGFSLVEMAIVLVIIGLIVSAIAVGKTTMRKGEATKAYQQYLNPWIQNALNTYQGTGTAGWGTNADLKDTYNFGAGTIAKTTSYPTYTAGILEMRFTLTSLTADESQELMGVFKNALTNSATSVTVSTTSLQVTFNVPAVSQTATGT
ncbi:MAG: type II secretion system protein [Magnetococcales bacterium]|nr:type II secretion system protein [Magnetococcales bacterium]